MLGVHVLSEADVLLFEAARDGSADLARKALANGADPNVRHDGETPLHRVATMSSGLVLPILVAAGADVNALNDEMRTPIECTGTSSIAMALFACGADISRDGAFTRENLASIGRTVAAIRCGVPDWIEQAVLVEKDESLRSLGLAAIASGAARETLLSISEADWNLVLSSERYTLESLNAAIQAGGDPNVSLHGRSPLHYAVEHHSINACKALIKAGAEIDAPDCDGFAPLHYASNLSKALAMIAFGANPEGCPPGKIFDELSGLSRIEAACRLASTGGRDESPIAEVLLSEVGDESDRLKQRSIVEILLRDSPDRLGSDLMRSWLAREASRDVVRGIELASASRSSP